MDFDGQKLSFIAVDLVSCPVSLSNQRLVALIDYLSLLGLWLQTNLHLFGLPHHLFQSPWAAQS